MFNVGDLVVRRDIKGRKRYRIERFATDGSGWIYARPEGGGGIVTFLSQHMLRLAGVTVRKTSGGGSQLGSGFERKLSEVSSVRHEVPRDMRPLFDHLLNLARDSHARGRAQRAGQELAKARKLAVESEIRAYLGKE